MRTYTAPDLRGRFVFRSREEMSMIIVLRPNASEHDLEQIVAKVAALGLTPHVSRGVTRTIVGCIGDEDRLRDMLLETATAVRDAGAVALRGGAFKPRTSPYSFRGLGSEALEMLAAVRADTGLPVVTEVLDTRHVALVA